MPLYLYLAMCKLPIAPFLVAKMAKEGQAWGNYETQARENNLVLELVRTGLDRFLSFHSPGFAKLAIFEAVKEVDKQANR